MKILTYQIRHAERLLKGIAVRKAKLRQRLVEYRADERRLRRLLAKLKVTLE